MPEIAEATAINTFVAGCRADSYGMGREWAADHLERMLRQEEIYRTRKEIRGAHDHPESRLYRIVVTSGTMLAVLNAEKRPEEQEVRHLFVAKHVREQRIGSELLEEFEACG